MQLKDSSWKESGSQFYLGNSTTVVLSADDNEKVVYIKVKFIERERRVKKCLRSNNLLSPLRVNFSGKALSGSR